VQGGADWEEAIEAALEVATKEPEELAPTKVLLIGDAPPHFEKAGQKVAGCDGWTLTTDYMAECEKLAKKEIPVYAFYLDQYEKTRDSFHEIAETTKGKAKLLKKESDLVDVVCQEALADIGGKDLVVAYKKKYTFGAKLED
jgi:hypothetical protein